MTDFDKMPKDQQISTLKTHKAQLLADNERARASEQSAKDALEQAQMQLAEKKHTEQLGAWAIDRALETVKTTGHRIDGDDFKKDATGKSWGYSETIGGHVTNLATIYCKWIMETSAKTTTLNETAH